MSSLPVIFSCFPPEMYEAEFKRASKTPREDQENL